MLRRLWIAAALLVSGTAVAQTAPNPSFNVVNRATSAINEVYASAAGNTNWGRDRLAGKTVATGATFAVRLPADGKCVYDIRVVYANGTSDERRNLNTCNLDNVIFPAPAGGRTPVRQQAADDPPFRLVNRGRNEANELYAITDMRVP